MGNEQLTIFWGLRWPFTMVDPILKVCLIYTFLLIA